jgi:mRNA-degrading endonuclease RelE of RelBE toxin-antitoxin system
MMFRILWEPNAFEQMQSLIHDNPALKAGFVFTLESLTMELGEHADTWGEARLGNYRLGYVGFISILVRIDEENRLVRIVSVQPEPRTRWRR